MPCSGSDSDNDDVIDIETIDELEGIMDYPDANQTFSSARTVPSKYNKRNNQPVSYSSSVSMTPVSSTVKTAEQSLAPTLVTSHIELSPIVSRTRLNSERIVNELVSLDSDSCHTDLPVPTKTIEPSIDSSALAELPVESAVTAAVPDFSILGNIYFTQKSPYSCFLSCLSVLCIRSAFICQASLQKLSCM